MNPIKVAFATEKYHHSYDSCYIFIHECAKRGWETYWFVFEDIKRKNGKIYADLRRVTKQHMGITPKKMIAYAEKFEAPLELMDIVFLKRDPPLPRKAMHLIKNLSSHVLVINDPHGILKYESKAMLDKFKKYTPPTFFSHKLKELIKIVKKLKNCVVKEDDSNGGRGVHHLYKEGNEFFINNLHTRHKKVNLEKFFKKLTRKKMNNITIAKYLERVGKGDKRIIVLDNHIVGSILRKPGTKNGWLCNVKSGGIVEKVGITRNERILVHSVAPELAKDKVYIAGFDTLEDDKGKRVLSEINTVNVGAFHLVERLYKKDVSKFVMDWVEKKVKSIS